MANTDPETVAIGDGHVLFHFCMFCCALVWSTLLTPLSRRSRSPEAAVLDEFLSILRPVPKTPSSPITRSKRLVPRSRLTLQPTAPGDRHHPYARVKSSSPLASETFESFSATRKRSSSRSSAKALARRRSSTLLSSNSSNSSQSVSRRGSDGSLNYVHPSCEYARYISRPHSRPGTD